ncbi:hypothetical protein [Paenibacillus agilis]|uniref:Uncharacterized protein n=1 Tax=Paenibacillus agilis TaxID=3020863 RepID=A0A559IZM0_9BACL|nr:hypothetical protein [Paenibacillus agilis]TVX93076.1 hypothetical protein FPZ44_08385 [Paenibacillus agilis]
MRVVAESTGSLIKHVSKYDIVLVSSPGFQGLTYDSPSGTLDITKNGELYMDNLLVLNDFLGFSQEQEIVYEKDVSEGVEAESYIKMTPDTLVEVIEEPEDETDINELMKRIEESMKNQDDPTISP